MVGVLLLFVLVDKTLAGVVMRELYRLQEMSSCRGIP